jgi:radical SAM superfamily enzyme YgiQ (UPF0313 family)
MLDEAITVSLVGRRLPDNENLGIGRLRAALDQASIPSRFHVLNVAEDLDGVVRQILDRGSTLVGLSLPDGGSAHLPLALGEMLHRRGWRGHTVAGGPFATLARRWLLERYPWLGSVVRFCGEIPIVRLASCLGRPSGDLDRIPGLTTRWGDGEPADVLDAAPLHTWPLRDELPVLESELVANIATSRGCRGRCGYCGPAALMNAEVAEGLARGHHRRHLVRCGVGGIRRRDVDDLCDEMAHLYHDRGVRYFNLVDEHPLPWHEEHALAFLAAWKRGLQHRDVGPVGIGTMMRPDRITPRIVHAFVDLGLVRAFLGIELGTPAEARLHGRPFMVPSALTILELLRDRGATVSNLMLVHPGSTPATIRSGIELLDAIPCAVETTRMQVYHGTRLHRQMQAQGRLVGNPLRYSYRIDDPCVQRFDEIFTRLRIEAFGDHSVAYALHDLTLALHFNRRLGRRVPSSLSRDCRRIEDRLRGLEVRTLGEALALAESGGGFLQCTDLVHRARAHADELRGEMRRISCAIHVPGQDRPLFSHVRAAATTALQVVMMAAPVASCHSSHPVGDADTDAIEDVADEEMHECTYEETSPIYTLVRETVHEAVPCFSGEVNWAGGTLEAVASEGERSGCMTEQTAAILEELEQDVVEAVQDLDLHPDGCEMRDRSMETHVYGQDSQQVSELTGAVQETCSPEFGECGWFLDGIVVVVDADGHVADVYARDWCTITDEALDCIRSALSGLAFPCLAGQHICPEPVLLD